MSQDQSSLPRELSPGKQAAVGMSPSAPHQSLMRTSSSWVPGLQEICVREHWPWVYDTLFATPALAYLARLLCSPLEKLGQETLQAAEASLVR